MSCLNIIYNRLNICNSKYTVKLKLVSTASQGGSFIKRAYTHI